MANCISREVRGVLVQHFDPEKGRIVDVRFQPEDGEHLSMDNVVDAEGAPVLPSPPERKAFLSMGTRDLFVPFLLASTCTCQVWMFEAGVLLVGIGGNSGGGEIKLQQVALVQALYWAPGVRGRKLEAWCRQRIKEGAK